MKVNINADSKKDIKCFNTQTLQEVEDIIDYLKRNPLILNLSSLKSSEVQTFLDLTCGACKALNKSICQINKLVYLFLDY